MFTKKVYCLTNFVSLRCKEYFHLHTAVDMCLCSVYSNLCLNWFFCSFKMGTKKLVHFLFFHLLIRSSFDTFEKKIVTLNSCRRGCLTRPHINENLKTKSIFLKDLNLKVQLGRSIFVLIKSILLYKFPNSIHTSIFKA